MNGIVLASIVVVGVILAIIAIIVIMNSSKPKKSVKTTVKKEEQQNFEFDTLMKIASNSTTSSKELVDSLKLFNQYFRIDDKNAHDYLIFLSKCLTHKNVDASVFKYFHNEIKNNNSKYKKELETIEMKALG